MCNAAFSNVISNFIQVMSPILSALGIAMISKVVMSNVIISIVEVLIKILFLQIFTETIMRIFGTCTIKLFYLENCVW